MDPNFSFSLNLAGIQAAGGGGPQLDEGYYKGAIVDAYMAENSNGGSRIVMKIGNIEGFPGAIRTTSITIPNENTKAGLVNVWRAAFESMAYTPAQIDSGAITVQRSLIVDRPAHFYYIPGDRDELKLLSPGQWGTQKQAFEAQASSNAQGSALGAAAQGNAAAGLSAGGGGLGGAATVNMGGGLGGGGGAAQTNGLGGGGAAQTGLTPQQLMAQLGQ